MKVKNLNTLGDYILSVAVVSQYFLAVLQQCMISILHLQPEITTTYRVVLSATTVILAFFFILKRNLIFTFKVYSVVFGIILLTYVLYPDNASYMEKDIFRFGVPICIPIMLSMKSIYRFDIFKKCVLYISWAIVFLLFLYAYYFTKGIFQIDSYSMTFGYSLLLPTLVLYSEKTLVTLIISFLSFLAIVIVGSRGPLLVIGIYIVLDMILYHKKYIPIFIIFVMALISSFWAFSDYLLNLGINSRTVTKIINGDIDDSSGRQQIIQETMSYVYQNPIFGLGIYGDRVLLHRYPHNILVEMMVQLGLPLTIMIIFILFFYSYKLFRTSPHSYKNMFLIVALSGIIPLMMSGTYLNYTPFYAYLGFIFYLYTKRKNNYCD